MVSGVATSTIFVVSLMACDGGNDYKQAHNGGKKRQKSTGSAVDLSVNVGR